MTTKNSRVTTKSYHLCNFVRNYVSVNFRRALVSVLHTDKVIFGENVHLKIYLIDHQVFVTNDYKGLNPQVFEVLIQLNNRLERYYW